MLPVPLTQLVGFFNIIVGLMLTVSILLMGAACLMWMVRLGTTPTYRDQAIHLMQWAIAILFTLTVILFIVQYVQKNTATAVYLIGFAVLAGIGWAIFVAMQGSGKDPDAEHA